MRTLLLIAALTAVGACQSTVDPQQPTATIGDVASYDAMRQATQACAAAGGHLELRRGADPTFASNYVCRRGSQ